MSYNVFDNRDEFSISGNWKEHKMSDELVGQEAINDTRIKQIAASVIAGKSVKDIAKDTMLSEYSINKVKKSEQFKTYLAEITDTVIKAAQTELKHEIAKRSKKIIAALDEELEGGKGRMEAIKTALRVLSVLDNKETDGGVDKGPLVVKFDLTGSADKTTIEIPNKGDK